MESPLILVSPDHEPLAEFSVMLAVSRMRVPTVVVPLLSISRLDPLLSVKLAALEEPMPEK